MLDLETIKAAILSNNFTDDQLIELRDAVKTARDELQNFYNNQSSQLGMAVKIARTELELQKPKFIPKKFNRIAAVLIGHSRRLGDPVTRNGSESKFFKLFNRMSEQVDYYILSWINRDYNTEIKTSSSFEFIWPNKLFYQLYDEDNLDYPRNHKIMKLSWLAKQAAKQIKIVQDSQQFNYDYVVECRVDQLVDVRSTRKTDFIKLDNNEILSPIQNTAVNKRKNWNPALDSIETFGFDHWYFRMNPRTYFEFSDRFDFFYQKNLDRMCAGPVLPRPREKKEAGKIGFHYHTGLAYYFLEKRFTFPYLGSDWDV